MTFGGKGWWEVVGKQSVDEARKLVDRSLDAGVNFIDTANVYSEGESERILGEILKGRRKDVILATKVRSRMGPGPNQVGLSRVHIMQAVEDSLRRLQTDYIDLYQIHGWDAATPLEETMAALDNLVQRGLVRHIGASNLAAWQLMKALGISNQNGWARFHSLQAYYTIAGRDLERELVPLMLDQNIGCMVWSPLAGGLLTGKFARDGSGGEGARRATFDFPPVNTDRVFDCVDVMKEIAEARGVSVAVISLAWLLHQPSVATVIIGAKRMDQLEDNLSSVDVDLTADELERLEKVSALEEEYPAWMIRRQGEGRAPA